MCSHDPIFRTDKESSIWCQNDHKDTFHLSRRVSDENTAYSISVRFFKITDPCVGRSFSTCSHDPTFGTNKILLVWELYIIRYPRFEIQPDIFMRLESI